MLRRFVAILTAALLAGAAAVAAPQQYKIVTASERGTYIQIGRDIAKFVTPAANIELEVLPSAGSAENVERLRYEPGVKFAMVQSDVYQAFLDLAAGGNADAGAMITPLRVIMPLYNEEIYFIVRADSYPNLLAEDVPSVAVKAFLVTYDYKLAVTGDHLARFARSLCQNFAQLQAQGHPKWREVQLGLPELGRGWSYYPLTERVLRTCALSQAQQKARCSQQERILGLCK